MICLLGSNLRIFIGRGIASFVALQVIEELDFCLPFHLSHNRINKIQNHKINLQYSCTCTLSPKELNF